MLVVLCVLLLTGCGKKHEQINVGFMGTLSGRYSDLGQATLQGVMLAAESSPLAQDINLVVKDDFGSPSEVPKILNDFKNSNVKYIIGPNLSSVATAAVPLLEGHDMTMLSPTVSTSELAGKKDKFFRTMPHNNYRQAEVISRYLLDKLNIRRVVVLYDARNTSYSDDIVKKFSEAYMRGGGEVMDVRSFDPDAGDSFSSLIGKDRDDQPDMYYIIGSAMDTSLLIWQVRKAGFDSKILIRKWAASNEFFRLGGDAVEGVMLFDYYIDKEQPEYKLFESEYKKRFQKDPSWMSVYGYETARMFLEALPAVRQGGDLLTAVNNAAKHNRLLLNLHLDENGDAQLPLHYFVIKKGETVYQEKAE